MFWIFTLILPDLGLGLDRLGYEKMIFFLLFSDTIWWNLIFRLGFLIFFFLLSPFCFDIRVRDFGSLVQIVC